MRSDILFWTIAVVKKDENIGRTFYFDKKEDLAQLIWSINNCGEFYQAYDKTLRPKAYL